MSVLYTSNQPVRFHSKNAITQLMAPLAHYAATAARVRGKTVSQVIDDIADPKEEPKFNQALRHEFAILYQDRIKEVFPDSTIQETLFPDQPVEIRGIGRAEVTVNDFDKMRARLKEVARDAEILKIQRPDRFDLDYYFDRRVKRSRS